MFVGFHTNLPLKLRKKPTVIATPYKGVGYQDYGIKLIIS